MSKIAPPPPSAAGTARQSPGTSPAHKAPGNAATEWSDYASAGYVFVFH